MILAVGRRSELVRERAGMIAENASSETLSSRTMRTPPRSLLCPMGRSLKALYYGLSRSYV
ncbi:hypothetical protein CXB36_11810 [Pseudomonas syringae pv. syringae]|nr:hypothetical protein BKC06_025150 [Pseudomonas syringae pv. syringae]POP65090.1 hypothetical protein CXB36_11810 [Pseudomonas syringae pv. syringae]